MRRNKKITAVLLAAIAMTLIFSLVLCACNDKIEEPVQENPAETEQGGGTENSGETAQLNVIFDEEATYNLSSFTEALDIKVVAADGTTHSAGNFVVKSAKVSDDGAFIEVVISAEGLEKTIRLPYSGDEGDGIRPDLRQLYNLAKKEGDKYVSLTLNGAMKENKDSAEGAFTLKAVANILKDGFQFALTSEGEETEVLVVFDGDALTIGDMTVSMEQLKTLIASLSEGFDFGLLTGEEFDETFDGNEEDEPIDLAQNGADETAEEDDVTAFFVGLSSVLNTVDGVFDTIPASVKTFVNCNAENGVYTVSMKAKRLVTVAELFCDDEEAIEKLQEAIDLIDDQLDGAIARGDLKVSVSFAIKNNGLAVEFKAENEATGWTGKINAAFELAEEAFAMPIVVAQDAGTRDIEITLPFSLPQKDFELLVKATVSPAAFLGEDCTTYVKVKAFMNGADEPVADLILDRGYAYLTFMGGTFYQGFGGENEPADVKEAMPAIIAAVQDIVSTVMAGDENEPDDDYGFIDDNTDPDFPYGATAEKKDDAELVFEIGATEADFLACFDLFEFNEDFEKIEYTGECRVEDEEGDPFDGSASFMGTLYIVFSEKTKIEVEDVVIYNPVDKQEAYVDVGAEYLIAIGSGLEGVESEIAYVASVTYTDGVVEWIEFFDGSETFTIVSVNGADVDRTFTFEETGMEIGIIVQRDSDGQEYPSVVHVYDPDDLVATEIACETDHVFVDADTTEEDIRKELTVLIIYEDYSSEETDDYDIEYEYGAEFLTIIWGELSVEVPLSYDEEETSPDDPDDFGGMPEPTSFLRFANGDEDTLTALFALLKDEATKELFGKVFTFEKDENGASLHIVVNAEEGDDLVDLLNVFVGMPDGMGGWTDIDENYLLSMVNMLGMMLRTDFASGFESVTGVAFADFLTELTVDVALTWNDGVAIDVELNNGKAEEEALSYFVGGIRVGLIDAEGSYDLSQEDIEEAQGFDAFVDGIKNMIALAKALQ